MVWSQVTLDTWPRKHRGGPAGRPGSRGQDLLVAQGDDAATALAVDLIDHRGMMGLSVRVHTTGDLPSICCHSGTIVLSRPGQPIASVKHQAGLHIAPHYPLSGR